MARGLMMNSIILIFTRCLILRIRSDRWLLIVQWDRGGNAICVKTKKKKLNCVRFDWDTLFFWGGEPNSETQKQYRVATKYSLCWLGLFWDIEPNSFCRKNWMKITRYNIKFVSSSNISKNTSSSISESLVSLKKIS